jgi:cysteine desulfurase
MAANNEIGTINPLKEIGSICKLYNIPFFVDAIQGFGKMILHPKQMGISMLSISGHKIYAPKGVGALYADSSLNLIPLIHGGGQESGLRAGTENVAYIMALGKASSVIYKEFDLEHKRLTDLRNYFLECLKQVEPNFIINGSLEKRLPNNLNIGFPDIDSGALLLSLNQIGVYVSSGSACHEGSKESSHVISSIGVDTTKYGIIRFSFGIKTTKEEIDYLFTYLPEILVKLKELKKVKNEN